MFKKFTLFLIIIFCLFFILFILGWQGKLFYTTNWYDKSLHFSAGICVFLAAWWLADKKSFFFKIFISFLFLLVVSVLWEVFEFTIDTIFNFPLLQEEPKDTLWDLIFDIFGGIFAVVILAIRRPRFRF